MPTKWEFPFSGHFLQGFLFQETKGAFQLFSGQDVPGNSSNSGTGGETPGSTASSSLTCLTAVLTSSGWGQEALWPPLTVLADRLTILPGLLALPPVTASEDCTLKAAKPQSRKEEGE